MSAIVLTGAHPRLEYDPDMNYIWQSDGMPAATPLGE